MKNLLKILVLLSGLTAQAMNNTTAPVTKQTTPKKATTTTATAKNSRVLTPETGKTVRVVLSKDNMVVMADYFEDETVAQVVNKAKQLDGHLKSNDPIYLVLKSGGGSIDAGLEMIENLNNLNHTVHTISIFSASMAFQTVQGVKGYRLVLKNGTLMSHKARGMFGGEFPGQLDSRYAYYLARVMRLDAADAARTNGKHSLQSYQNLIENEYWCDGQDCINQGFADYIVNASCDASLNGQHNKLADRFLYMGHTIEIIETYADCALITSPLSWNILIDGEPMFKNSYEVIPDSPKIVTTSKPDTFYSSYDRPINESLKDKLGLETCENIKKLVVKRLDARSNKDVREVRKY